MSWLSLNDIRNSLNFIADHGYAASGQAVSATTTIFFRTRDDEIRRACLDSLSRISNSKARNELQKISKNQTLDSMWRDIADANLRRLDERTQPIAATINASPLKVGQP